MASSRQLLLLTPLLPLLLLLLLLTLLLPPPPRPPRLLPPNKYQVMRGLRDLDLQARAPHVHLAAREQVTSLLPVVIKPLPSLGSGFFLS
jgi:hypothetical protein